MAAHTAAFQSEIGSRGHCFTPRFFFSFGMKTLTFELSRFLIHITNVTVMCVASPPRGLGTSVAPVLSLVILADS